MSPKNLSAHPAKRDSSGARRKPVAALPTKRAEEKRGHFAQNDSMPANVRQREPSPVFDFVNRRKLILLVTFGDFRRKTG